MLALPAIELVRKDAPAAGQATDRGERKLDQIRPLKIRTGVVSCAAGSAMLELGRTKVVCSVYGPHATDGREYLDKGRVECTFHFAPFARPGRRTRSAPGGSDEEKLLRINLGAALGASVQVHLLPKSIIAVHALVLQDDGGALPAAISCASLALADASIQLYGLVAASECGVLPKAEGAAATDSSGSSSTACECALDISTAELALSRGSAIVACMPELDHMTLVRHEGLVPFEKLTESMQLGLSGCSLLHEQMASALKAKLTSAAELSQGQEPPAESGVGQAAGKRMRHQ